MKQCSRRKPGRWIGGLCGTILASAVILAPADAAETQPTERPKVTTHQSYVEDVFKSTADLPLARPNAMFGFVFDSLPDRVKVYPTENYYYFNFIYRGVRYAGNIRLDAKDRDSGKVHFAYFEDLAEWREEPPMNYRVLDQSAGVTLDKVDRFVYRMTYRNKTVTFELNDLSAVAPPPNALTADETYLGPVFDDSAVRFFLVYNSKLKAFHYILDETAAPTEDFLTMRQTDRILIGKRTGFAFYHDPQRNRKMLIGVFEGNARVNNAFDGPFDQLPDNFIEGDALRNAIIEVEPSMKGKIDRYGGISDGSGRFLIAPYAYYRTEADLLPFHACATNKRVPAEDYYACFVLDWTGNGEISAIKRMNAAHAKTIAAKRKTAHAKKPAAQ
jgi:hypothetical protein